MASKPLGLAMTVLGILLFIYAMIAALSKGQIGSKDAWTPDAIAILIGWFMLLIGPAIAFGEAPASVKPTAGRR